MSFPSEKGSWSSFMNFLKSSRTSWKVQELLSYLFKVHELTTKVLELLFIRILVHELLNYLLKVLELLFIWILVHEILNYLLKVLELFIDRDSHQVLEIWFWSVRSSWWFIIKKLRLSKTRVIKNLIYDFDDIFISLMNNVNKKARKLPIEAI